MQSDSPMPPIRRCRVKLSDLADAFDQVSTEMAGFLDLEAGEVLFVTDEMARELERIYESLPAELANASDEEQRAALAAAFEEERLPDWQREQLLENDAIDRGLGTRYVALPEADTRADYDDMEAFVETVSDARFRSRLDRAIRGRGAFRRFRDELRDAEVDEEQRWYAFKQERLVERARAWLADEGIALVED